MSSVSYRPALVNKHRDIDLEIQNEESRPLPDSIRLRELKMKKLRIKEQILSL
jgi:hypothetical protein